MVIGSQYVLWFVLTSIDYCFQRYNDCLLKKPILTKGITAALVNLFGDVLAQFLEASVAGVAFVPNLARLEGFFLCGLLYVGPYVHTWYEILWKIGSWMEEKYNSPKQVQTLVQLILDQTVGAVFCFTTYFYTWEIIDAFVNHRGKYIISRIRFVNICVELWPISSSDTVVFLPSCLNPTFSASIVRRNCKDNRKYWISSSYKLLRVADYELD